MKVFKVTFYEGATPVTIPEEQLKSRRLDDDMFALNIGDKMTIQALEISKEQFESLPEWDGP